MFRIVHATRPSIPMPTALESYCYRYYYYCSCFTVAVTVAVALLLLLINFCEQELFPGVAELTTQLLRLASILWLPSCRINKLGNTAREDCCDPLHLWVINYYVRLINDFVLLILSCLCCL